MFSVDPTPEQFKAARKNIPADTPILMLNMLRFRETASYIETTDQSACTGREAYKRYSELSFPKIQTAGGKIDLKANALASMIAPADEHWDEVFVVNWPSFQAFLDVILSPEYQAGTFHRTAALLDSRLIMLEAK